MNNPQQSHPPALRHSVPALLALLVLTLLTSLLLATGCKKGGTETKPDNVEYYTCTMHPSVKKQIPTDKCPICGMGLLPVLKKGTASAHEHVVHNAEMPGMPMGSQTNAPNP